MYRRTAWSRVLFQPKSTRQNVHLLFTSLATNESPLLDPFHCLISYAYELSQKFPDCRITLGSGGFNPSKYEQISKDPNPTDDTGIRIESADNPNP